jgi:hypothetical protein
MEYSSYVVSTIFLSWSALIFCVGEMQIIHEDVGIPVDPVGCFERDHDYRDLPYNVTNLAGSLSAESCTAVCRQQFFR